MDNPLTVSAEQAQALITSEAVTILDARDARSYRAGHIAGAVLLHDGLEQFLVEQAEFDKPILVYCYRGVESMKKATRLLSLGFQRVYSLENGFTGWPRDGAGATYPAK